MVYILYINKAVTVKDPIILRYSSNKQTENEIKKQPYLQ